MASSKKTSRGGSKRGKLKKGISRNGFSHSHTRNSVKKKLKRD